MVITALTRKTTGLWSVRVRRSKESQGFFAAIDLTFTKFACLLSCIFPDQAKPGIHGVSPIEYKVNKVSLERYRSGHNENDSKSFDGQKPSVGSNPTRSAIKETSFVCRGKRGFFLHLGQKSGK